MGFNDEKINLAAYEEALKVFNGLEENAPMLLAECKMNYTGFLDQHPQFKTCFAYAGEKMYVGLYQHFLESAGYVKTIDWKAPAGLCVYALAKCGLPEQEYRKLDLNALAPYDTHAILCRIGLQLESSNVRLFQIAPEYDDVFVAGIAPVEVVPTLIQSAGKIGVHITCMDQAYVDKNGIDINSLCDKTERIGIDAIYQKMEEDGLHYLFSDVRYSETGRIHFEDTPFGQRLSPEWLKTVLEDQPELLKAYHEGKAELVLSVVYGTDVKPLIFNDPYTRFADKNQ